MKKLTLLIQDRSGELKVEALFEKDFDDGTWRNFKYCCLRYPESMNGQIFDFVQGALVTLELLEEIALHTTGQRDCEAEENPVEGQTV